MFEADGRDVGAASPILAARIPVDAGVTVPAVRIAPTHATAGLGCRDFPPDPAPGP